MGSPVSQVQAPQDNSPSGKGGVSNQQTFQAPVPENQSDGVSRPMGKGGRVTYPGQDGQPRMGMPNQYSNTVGPWDNANIQRPASQSGKGKGI